MKQPRILMPFAAVVAVVCLSVASSRTSAQDAASSGGAPRVLFLVTEDPYNYHAWETIPPFAKELESDHGLDCTVIQGEGSLGAVCFPGLKKALKTADLLVIFFRRCALPADDMKAIRGYLASGRPLVAIRTANHAFAVKGKPAEGHEMWWEFVPEVLGCGNYGYGSEETGADVFVEETAADHPILKNVDKAKWHSEGCLYLVAPLAENCTVLLRGKSDDKEEPLAWTREYGKSRVFYTSLGFGTDFEKKPYRQLLTNGILWALGKGSK